MAERGSAAFMILNVRDCPSVVSIRKFWSRSLGRGVNAPSMPKFTRRCPSASALEKAGRGLVRMVTAALQVWDFLESRISGVAAAPAHIAGLAPLLGAAFP